MRSSILIILVWFVACNCSSNIFQIRSFIPQKHFECDIAIAFFRPESRSLFSLQAISMNFHTETEDNWNYEELSTFKEGVDKTKEKLAGGLLKFIKIEPKSGTFCLKRLEFACGPQTNELRAERSIILDAPILKKANSKLAWNSTYNCVWISSNQKSGYISKINVRSTAFTKCEKNDGECLKGQIEVFDGKITV